MNTIKLIKDQIAMLQGQIEKIQSECSHPKSALRVKPGANTGNYDPTADCYWTDYECGLCEKRWTEDQ
jgi:hypothetical protein